MNPSSTRQDAERPVGAGAQWVACHDTLVCFGARQIQKWCVRERDKKGPLVAVMLTKDVALLLAASPEMLAALEAVRRDERKFHCSSAATLDRVAAAIAKATGAAP
jgi:hypothetical protein